MEPARRAAIKSLPGNAACADCGAADPEFASLAHASLVCRTCADAHRARDVGVVQSLADDDAWSDKQTAVMLRGGNAALAAWLSSSGSLDASTAKYTSDAASQYRAKLLREGDVSRSKPPAAAAAPPPASSSSSPLQSTVIPASPSPSAFPVVCLHGMFESRLVFANSTPPPSIVLIALDRPGYGPAGSWPSSARSFSYAAFAQAAIETLNDLGFANASFGIVGHSSGGPCALALAAAAGARCSRVVLVAADPEYAVASNLADPFGGALPPAPAPDAPADELGLRTERELEMDREGELDGTLRAAIAASQGGNGPLLDFAVERRPWGIDLGKLACEVDVLYGSADPFFTLDHALFFACSAAEARLFPRPGMGHFDIVLDADAFAFVMSLFEEGMPVDI